jgi:hypothetical protein
MRLSWSLFWSLMSAIISLSEQTPQVSVWRGAGKRRSFVQPSAWPCGILWSVVAHALARGELDGPAESRSTVIESGRCVMVASPQELNTSVKDRSAGSGARVERGLPGAFAFLVKEGRRWNIMLVG